MGRWANSIQQIKDRLSAIHPAGFEPNWYIRRLFTRDIAERFVREAVVIRPENIIHCLGIPFLCHRNAWDYAMDRLKENLQYTGMPFIGWRLFEEDGHRWGIHSFVVEDQGRTVIESGGSLPDGAPAVYLAIAWNVEIVERLRKRQKKAA